MKMILIIVALTAICLIGFGVAQNIIQSPEVAASSLASAATEGVTASISGEVLRPGTFVLSKGATMYDLIQAASGVTSNADALAFNTDYVLTNKGTYYIAPLYDNSSTCSAAPIAKANINKADAETLQSVSGFTKTVAAAIVSYRLSKSFDCLEDIKNVSGIGAATYLSCRDKITLRDAA